ncbi:hypothetical protein CR513_12578, partial [Mucuna pruriens]
MKAFPFSLDGVAKDWLYLQPILFNTWRDMKCMFLEKFFPASRTATIRNKIYGIRQHSGETLHEYWERFNKLCATCPHHQISEQLLTSLTMMDQSMIDVASGGALMDKTPAVARHLISNMASNTQQFGIRGASQSRMLTELTSLVRQLAIGQHQPSIVARSWPNDNQQFGKQPFRPRPSQGPYAAQRFKPGPNAPQGPTCYRQPTPQYQAPPFQQQQ